MDKLFYSYTSEWTDQSLESTKNLPNSIVFHPNTHRIAHNGVIYGNGEGGPIFIKGSGSAVGAWIGQSPLITKYYEGLSIIYLPDKNGINAGTTLNINNLGTVNCYWTGSSKLTTQFGSGTPILFSYVLTSGGIGMWKRADYSVANTNTFETTTYNSDIDYSYFIGFYNRGGEVAQQYAYTNNNLKYNPGTATLSTVTFEGHLKGNADTSDISIQSKYTSYLKTFKKTSGSYYITFGNDTSYNNAYISEDLTFNAGTKTLGTNIMTATDKFIGNLQGNADTADFAINSTNSVYSSYSSYLKVNSKDIGTYNIIFGNGNNSYTSAYINGNLKYDAKDNILYCTNFNGNYFKGDLIGTAYNASYIKVEQKNTNKSYYITFIYNNTNGNKSAYINTALKYIPSQNVTYTIADQSAKTLITNTNTNKSYYLTFVNDSNNGQRYSYVNSNLYYNPYKKTLTVTNLEGTATNASYFKVSNGKNGSYNVVFSSANSGNASAYVSSNLNYDYTNNILESIKFKGDLIGNADTATNANYASSTSLSNKSQQILIQTNNSNIAYLLGSKSKQNNQYAYNYIDSDLYYNPNTNILHSNIFEGNLNGNASSSTVSIDSTNTSYFKVSDGKNGTYNIILSSINSGNASAYVSSNLKYDYTNNVLQTVSVSAKYHHTDHDSDDYVILAGGGTKPLNELSVNNHDHDDIYVKLDAGANEQTIKNSIGSISNGSIEIWRAVADGYPMIGFAYGTTKTKLGFLGFSTTANVPMFRTTSGTMYKLAHEGNISDSTTNTLGTSNTTIATIAGKNITAKVDHVANNVTSEAGTNTTGNTITIPNITVNSAGHITNLGSHTHTIDSISWYKDESITISTAGKWYRIATLATTNEIRGSVTFFLYNAGGNYNAIWTKFSFDSGWVRGNANWIKIEGDTGIWDGLSITTNTNNIYINIHCISATSYGHLYVPTNAAIGASKNEDFTWHSGTLTQTPSSETLGSQFFVGNNTGIHITGTLSKTTSADFNTPLISLCSPNLDSWLWRIKDRDTGAANATESVCGYGLKYIGTGAGADNRLRLIADNQNGTAVTAVSINQSGQIGIGTDSNSSYRVYVNGASMFKGIINIDSNSVGAGTHINFNRVGYNYINIPTDGKLTISVNGAASANGRLQITSTAVTPGEISNYANAPTLGTTSYKWKALYVGSDASYGSDSQPVYWNNGVPKAITYTLLSGVKGGTANRMAWYESATSIAAAASIYASGTALAINSTSITSGYNFQVLGSSLMRLIAPQTTNTYDMGSTSLRWKSMYNVEEYIGTASGSQCHLNFDNTNKCLRFTFD